MNRIIAFIRKKNKTFTEQLIELVFIFIPIIFVVRTFLFGLYQVPTGSMETTLLVGERFFADKLTVWFTDIKRGDIISFNDPNFNYSKNASIRLMQNYLWLPGGLTPSNWTKRVIAIPGDEIKGVIEDGKPVVYLKKNGETEFVKLDEPYLNQYPLLYVYTGNPQRPIRPESYDPDASFADQPFYKMNKKDVEMGALYASMAGVSSIEYPQTPLILDKGTKYERNVDIYHVKLAPKQYWVMGDNRLGSADSRAWGVLDTNIVPIHGRIVYRIFSMDSAGEDWLLVDLIKHPIDFFKRIRWERCLETVK